MILGRVIGTVWATHKEEKLTGLRFLIVRPLELGGNEPERRLPIVAMDSLGCGRGQTVLLVQGLTAQKVVRDVQIPVDAAVVALVDRIDCEGGDGGDDTGATAVTR